MTQHLTPNTYKHLSPATYHLPRIAFHLPLTTDAFHLATFYFLPVTTYHLRKRPSISSHSTFLVRRSPAWRSSSLPPQHPPRSLFRGVLPTASAAFLSRSSLSASHRTLLRSKRATSTLPIWSSSVRSTATSVTESATCLATLTAPMRLGTRSDDTLSRSRNLNPRAFGSRWPRQCRVGLIQHIFFTAHIRVGILGFLLASYIVVLGGVRWPFPRKAGAARQTALPYIVFVWAETKQ